LGAEAQGFPCEQNVRVGFFVEEDDEGRHDSAGGKEDPVYPAPAGTLGEEAAGDRANDRAE
jgi:hypothetical protein